jgi:hypothetical protein
VVVAVNKWDKVDPELWTEETMDENIRAQLREVGWAEVVCTTATWGQPPRLQPRYSVPLRRPQPALGFPHAAAAPPAIAAT